MENARRLTQSKPCCVVDQHLLKGQNKQLPQKDVESPVLSVDYQFLKLPSSPDKGEVLGDVLAVKASF